MRTPPMDTNDLCRRLRYALQLDDADTARLMTLGGHHTQPADAAAWRGREGDANYALCPPAALSAMLSGLILERRGPGDGPSTTKPQSEPSELDNNAILKAVKIALSLRTEDVKDCVVAGGGRVSNSEISSLLRRPGTRNYRGCGDQMLRRFLGGLAQRERGSSASTTGTPTP